MELERVSEALSCESSTRPMPMPLTLTEMFRISQRDFGAGNRQIGRGTPDSLRKASSNCMWVTILFCVALTVIFEIGKIIRVSPAWMHGSDI